MIEKLLDALADWVWWRIDWQGFLDERALQTHALRHSGRPVLMTYKDGDGFPWSDGSGWRYQPTWRGIWNHLLWTLKHDFRWGWW